jgi:adenylate cyclase
MPTEKVKRKLTAILSADVKGYSRLMGADEVGTIRILQTYRGVISALIQKKGGRVVDSPGDNVLAEFASVVDALESAVEIQKELKVRNADRSESRRMEFRIGINLGDVVEEGERIYGDGVNIAARIEGLAEGGGICISGTAFDHIGKRLPLGYEYMGEQAVKNIEKPVRVYRVLTEPEQAGKVIGERKPKRTQWRWAVAAAVVLAAGAFALWNFYWRAPRIEPASKEKMAFSLPDKPSIAVLPFDNLSGDREQDYLAEGITENIISYLSKIPELFIIDRKSTSVYKGKPVKVQQVSEDMGVRYVLEGSVQKSENRLRVTAHLVDALKGRPLWSDRYDRDLQDLFALQDEITLNILKEMRLHLTRGEMSRRHSTTNIEAWSYTVKGISLAERVKKEANLEARNLYEKALKLDFNYGIAWSNLAWTYLIEAQLGWTDSRADSLRRALELAQKSQATGNVGAEFHTTMTFYYFLQGKYEEAIGEGEKAIAMEPNNANSYAFLARALRYAGRPNETIDNVKKAMRLHPYYPAYYLLDLGGAYDMAGQYNEALATFKNFLERSLKGDFFLLFAHEWLTITYGRLGQMEKARSHADEILKINPKYTVAFFRKSTPYKDLAYLDGLVSLLF